MLRLLQGDVGAGKTVVALLAAATVVEAGRQAALMAPTEILARQHLATIAPLAEAAGLRVAILTGRERGARARRHAGAARLRRTSICWSALTRCSRRRSHSAISALAIVDEQHRFGVHQRLALARKGEAVDVLVLTATPIPRTLVLTYFGDMDVSQLREKPAGRQPIDTRALPLGRLDEVVERSAARSTRASGSTGSARWSSESEISDLAAAERALRGLQARVSATPVDLVHGSMKGAEKDAAMARFAAGETRLLVATTVIEVGVDVPEATVMVIEHAERFGLAQLHQLRGRVGRGTRALDLPAALPRAARRDRQGAARDHARDRGRLPHRRGGPAAARRRRCARHPAEPACPASASRASRSTAAYSRPRATMRS